MGSPEDLEEFKILDSKGMKELMKTVSSKTSGLDPVPTWLVKECREELSEIMLFIINGCLSQGIFPKELKKGLVRPLLKKK